MRWLVAWGVKEQLRILRASPDKATARAARAKFNQYVTWAAMPEARRDPTYRRATTRKVEEPSNTGRVRDRGLARCLRCVGYLSGCPPPCLRSACARAPSDASLRVARSRGLCQQVRMK